MNWSDMSYDEQRAALGLWQPSPVFHLQRTVRSFQQAFGPVIIGMGAALAAMWEKRDV